MLELLQQIIDELNTHLNVEGVDCDWYIEQFEKHFKHEDELDFDKVETYLRDLDVEVNELVYHNNCMNWLLENDYTDFKEAFDEGCTNLEQIANYYHYHQAKEDWDNALNEALEAIEELFDEEA